MQELQPFDNQEQVEQASEENDGALETVSQQDDNDSVKATAMLNQRVKSLALELEQSKFKQAASLVMRPIGLKLSGSMPRLAPCQRSIRLAALEQKVNLNRAE